MSDKDATTPIEGDDEVQIIDFEKDKKKKKDKKDKKDKKEKKEKSDEDDEDKKEKKKKKKEKKEKKDLEDGEEEDKHDDVDVDEVDDLADFTQDKKKKKSKKEKASKFDDVAGEAEEEKADKKAKVEIPSTRVNLNTVEGHEPFEYEFLLTRIADHIKSISGEDGASGSSFKLFEPVCTRTKTKSTWVNFDQQAQAIGRDVSHIMDYYLSELGCQGNIGSNNELTLVGRYQA